MNKKEKKQKVLGILQTNARITAVEIAERLMLEREDVEAIIKDSETKKEIHGYYTLISPDALDDKQVNALIEVNVSPEREHGFDHIARKISKFPQVTDLMLVSCTYDLTLTVKGESLHDVADFVATKLAPMDGIKGHSTHFILKKYKEAGFQLDDDEEYERLNVTL